MAEIKERNRFHIFSAAYIRSAVGRAQYVEDGKKEIAFLGRSNVGKSSLINSLCGQRKLALVSKEPGKTKTINYFAIQSRRKEGEEEARQDWYLVDLPGYGFAKAAQQSKDAWSGFIAEYVRKSRGLSLLCLLIDLRHPGLPIDKKAYDWLRAEGVPLLLVGTKADKLGGGERGKNLAALKREFPTDRPPIAYSSLDGRGREELLAVLEEIICGGDKLEVGSLKLEV